MHDQEKLHYNPAKQFLDRDFSSKVVKIEKMQSIIFVFAYTFF